MEYRDEKRRFYRNIVKTGAKQNEISSLAEKIGVGAPAELISKWNKRFFQSPIDTYPKEPRLINRFCVGADPEFIFQSPKTVVSNAAYLHAEGLGFTTMDAFGCDMSGRQAELRAFPSRFVLEVVASLMDTVRWMNESKKLDNIDWIAPAKYQDDGVGGHVHIGRKRPDINISIPSLDVVTSLLCDAGVLDKAGQKNRVLRTAYGKLGDWRPQAHGYEYRTMPSWMTSPWAAYFTLVVSKLCVLDDAKELLGNGRPVETLTNLLRAYMNRDDDARICLLGIEKHGFPKFLADDFKGRWGVGQSAGLVKPHYFPPIIKADEATCVQLFDFLVKGTALPKTLPTPTWRPFLLPENMHPVTCQAHVYGVSDIAQGLLSVDSTVYFAQGDRKYLSVQSTGKLLPATFQKEIMKYEEISGWKVSVGALSPTKVPAWKIFVPRDIYNNEEHAIDKGMRTALRSFLTKSGLFPLIRYQDWDKPLPTPEKLEKKREPRPIGRVESSVQGEAAIRVAG
jgi:hypothetical protein